MAPSILNHTPAHFSKFSDFNSVMIRIPVSINGRAGHRCISDPNSESVAS